jgi:hypothetical protein
VRYAGALRRRCPVRSFVRDLTANVRSERGAVVFAGAVVLIALVLVVVMGEDPDEWISELQEWLGVGE